MPQTTFKASAGRVAIIGGGPAGCATALSFMKSLRKLPGGDSSWDLCLFDADDPCSVYIGETIPPAATPVLFELGVGHILENSSHLKCPGSISVWGSDTPHYNDFILDPVGSGYHLDRQFFNESLRNEVKRQGGKILKGRHLSGVRQQGEVFELTFQLLNGEFAVANADYVVDASGKGAIFARRLGVARNLFDQVTSLCAVVPVPKEESMLRQTMLEAVAEGWWYAARLPHSKMIVSFTSDQDLIKEKTLKDPANWLKSLKQTRWMKNQLPLDVLGTSPKLYTRISPSAILSNVTG